MQNLPEEVAHKEAIRNLQILYSLSIDSGDYNRLDEIFTENAVGVYGRSYVGIEEIKHAMYFGCEYLTSVQHFNGNHWSRITNSTAEAGCYLHVIQYLEGTLGGDFHEMGGQYFDELLLTDDGWRITKRSIDIKWTKGNTLVREKNRKERDSTKL